MTAAVEIPSGTSAHGVVIAQGGRFGGWTLYVKDGRLRFVYNLLGMTEFTTESAIDLPPGKHQIRVEFAYDGGGLALGGDVTRGIDTPHVGSGSQ